MEYITKTGIVTEDLINMVFGDSQNYLEDFSAIHKSNIEFKDFKKGDNDYEN